MYVELCQIYWLYVGPENLFLDAAQVNWLTYQSLWIDRGGSIHKGAECSKPIESDATCVVDLRVS